jgi:hypothetical protein
MNARPAAAADLAWSVAWIALGAAIVYGSWTMDRLEKMNINPYTVPGLVPGLLGAVLLLLGLVLLARSVRARGLVGAPGAEPAAGGGRFWLALALCLAYGGGLVGRGVPFWLATFAFVFVAIAALEWPERRARGTLARGIARAAACAAGTAAGVTLVFQELFLVRLP